MATLRHKVPTHLNIEDKAFFGMTLRQIDDRPRKGKGSRGPLKMRHYPKDELTAKSQTQNLRIILDGQQRITALWRSLHRARDNRQGRRTRMRSGHDDAMG